MLNYPDLNNILKLTSPGSDFHEVVEYLMSRWLDDYYRRGNIAQSHVVEISNKGFSYLFDIRQERLLAAWGISKGKNTEPRDKSRMRGHPLSAGIKYHRGMLYPILLAVGLISILWPKRDLSILVHSVYLKIEQSLPQVRCILPTGNMRTLTHKLPLEFSKVFLFPVSPPTSTGIKIKP